MLARFILLTYPALQSFVHRLFPAHGCTLHPFASPLHPVTLVLAQRLCFSLDCAKQHTNRHFTLWRPLYTPYPSCSVGSRLPVNFIKFSIGRTAKFFILPSLYPSSTLLIAQELLRCARELFSIQKDDRILNFYLGNFFVSTIRERNYYHGLIINLLTIL